MSPEARVSTIYFNDADEYNQYFRDLGLPPFTGGRAKGLRFKDGHIEIVVDTSYYLQAGLSEEMVQALVVHEQTELGIEGPDAHRQATVAEYQYIFDHFGESELKRYHGCICTSLGGPNEVRSNALTLVLLRNA